jgi:ribosomal protein S4
LAASATASESGWADEADMSDQHLIETLPEAFHGERIDRVVSAIAGISRSLAKELIVASKVLVDGRPITTASRKVDAGTIVTIELPAPEDPTPAPSSTKTTT